MKTFGSDFTKPAVQLDQSVEWACRSSARCGDKRLPDEKIACLGQYSADVPETSASTEGSVRRCLSCSPRLEA